MDRAVERGGVTAMVELSTRRVVAEGNKEIMASEMVRAGLSGRRDWVPTRKKEEREAVKIVDPTVISGS